MYMNKYTCKRCGKNFQSYHALRKHVGRIHKIHSTEFYVEFHLNNTWPLCKCGCGQKVKWDAKNKRFRELVHGHYSRIHNNWGHNQKAIDASAKTRREQYANGERKVWNEGLTLETDERVKSYGRHVASSFTGERKNRYSKIMSDNRLNGIVPTLSGQDHPQWQGGISSINQLARADHRLYTDWKLPILQRDGFKCTTCPNTANLHVHHSSETFSEIIKKVMTLDDFDHIEDFSRKREVANKVVEYHVKNQVSGVTLCAKCHNKLHPSLNFL